ncbi:hypothetical protein [Dactylosporangium sp. NPDC050588]|uniref:hypothetical protein n=1 Tax=Dactylosporangium sp. NPDC050588 TaxID=3157211 RepID=UPI003403FA23
MTTRDGDIDSARVASCRTLPRVAATRSTTGTLCSPSSRLRSSTRRFGFGSHDSGTSRACRCAARPVRICPLAPTQTVDGSSGDPSNSMGRTLPSGYESIATVLEVP